jgi:2-amino-4-hydroxy-6-hydroxymethyldihydropteridine diphosphokinase
MNEFYIALGANLPSGEGSPKATLLAALQEIREADVVVASVSHLYQTPCFPAGAGPDYVNGAARLVSDRTPAAMLDLLHTIEARFGRERKERWGMRTLDLDLIASGDAVFPNRETFEQWRRLAPDLQKRAVPDQLVLPHPRLQDRAFVLVPLRDIAAHWRHPVLNRTVEDMYTALSPEDLAEIVVLET